MAEFVEPTPPIKRFVMIVLFWRAIPDERHEEDGRSLPRAYDNSKDSTRYNGTTPDTDRDRHDDLRKRPRRAPGVGRCHRTTLPPQGSPSGAAGSGQNGAAGSTGSILTVEHIAGGQRKSPGLFRLPSSFPLMPRRTHVHVVALLTGRAKHGKSRQVAPLD